MCCWAELVCREPPGILESCTKRWMMGNLLYWALRLVLGALTAAVCMALRSTLSSAGGFQGLVFCLFFFWVWGMVFK